MIWLEGMAVLCTSLGVGWTRNFEMEYLEIAMSSSLVFGTKPCDEMKMGDGVDCLGIGVIVKG